MSDPAIAAKVALLAQAFLAKLPARLDQIDAAFALCRADMGNALQWQETYRLLHSLGGAAGTFGVAAVGLEARRIELLIQRHLDAGDWQEAHLQQIAQALEGLRAMA